jgi:hypothetical protein
LISCYAKCYHSSFSYRRILIELGFLFEIISTSAHSDKHI